MKKNIVFITGNEGKRKEVEQILGNKCTIVNVDLDVPEIQSISVEEVTNEKIKSAYELLKENFKEVIQKFNEKGVQIKTINDVIVICEDTGLYINDMNNFPGALIKFYLGSLNNEGIAKMNGGSLAKAETVIGVIKYGKIMKAIVGSRTGKIAKKFVSKDSFGWDPIFIPDLTKTKYSEYNGKTYAELKNLEIKNEISHRKNAFDKFKKTILK
jgi:non-canonical purine NTP pyrophosphatase (RdgB/HAM1 family)